MSIPEIFFAGIAFGFGAFLGGVLVASMVEFIEKRWNRVKRKKRSCE